MDHDRFPALGPKTKHVDADAVRAAVQHVWPKAYAEGSTGWERSWWVADPEGGDPVLVAHHWPVDRRWRSEEMFARIVDPAS